MTHKGAASEGTGATLLTDAAPLQHKWDAAWRGLRANLQTVLPDFPPVLIEGAEYAGIWLECGPHESLLYGLYANDPETARNGHRIFFQHQDDDGFLPPWVRNGRIGGGHVQTVVPIARTATEVHALWPDLAFLDEAYIACARYDDWLSTYRDTLGAGLCELFCEWDTGHDNSPRVAGLPHACPGWDARVCPDSPELRLPRIAPDLSAAKYGGKMALALMAEWQGRLSEAEIWKKEARKVRERLFEQCFDHEDVCFFDRNHSEEFVRIPGDALTRVLQEHALSSRSLFERIYKKWIHNPEAFWTPYPLPSIAANSPAFVRDLPRNSWGGASQALTALRAPLWFEHYGKRADLVHLMKRWLEALCRSEGFRQQMNPWTGEFTAAGSDGYSPAMLCLVDFTARLYGITIQPEQIEWNCRLPEGASSSRFTMTTPAGDTAENQRDGDQSTLIMNAVPFATVRGGACRIVTDRQCHLHSVVSTEAEPVDVEVTIADGETHRLHVEPGRMYRLAGLNWRVR